MVILHCIKRKTKVRETITLYCRKKQIKRSPHLRWVRNVRPLVWNTSVLRPFGVHCSTFLSICARLCNSFHYSSFEYTLRSTWRLNRPTPAKNAQYNLLWAYPQPAYALAYMLTQMIHCEKIYNLTLAERRIC